MSAETPTAAEVQRMRGFLARVVRTPVSDIKVTGDPATDSNTDILLTASEGPSGWKTLKKLDLVRAIEIDNILAGDTRTRPDGNPDLPTGARMFADYLAQRRPLYS